MVSGGIDDDDDDDDAVRLSKLDRIVECFSRAGRRRGEATRRTGAGDGTSSVVVVFVGVVAREERDRIERERYAEKKTGWARSQASTGGTNNNNNNNNNDEDNEDDYYEETPLPWPDAVPEWARLSQEDVITVVVTFAVSIGFRTLIQPPCTYRV